MLCLVEVFQKGILLLVIAVLLFTLDWRVASLLFISFIPGVLMRLKHARKLYELVHRGTASERQATYFSSILTDDVHAKELRLFNLGGALYAPFSRYPQAVARRKTRVGEAPFRS